MLSIFFIAFVCREDALSSETLILPIIKSLLFHALVSTISQWTTTFRVTHHHIKKKNTRDFRNVLLNPSAVHFPQKERK